MLISQKIFSSSELCLPFSSHRPMSLIVFVVQKGCLCAVRLESVPLCETEYCNTHVCVVQFYRNWGTCELSQSLTLYSGGRHGVASARLTSKQSGQQCTRLKNIYYFGVYIICFILISFSFIKNTRISRAVLHCSKFPMLHFLKTS